MPRSVELISVSVASPQAAPATATRRDQQIAVKVIDDRGNELLVVKRLDGWVALLDLTVLGCGLPIPISRLVVSH